MFDEPHPTVGIEKNQDGHFVNVYENGEKTMHGPMSEDAAKKLYESERQRLRSKVAR